MIQHKNLFIKEKDNIDLYIIGYKSMGESIILNIANQFVGVIDCYRTQSEFVTLDILEYLRKTTSFDKLDFICWTHADLDHTKGLSQLFKYVGDETAFIMPQGISYKELCCEINPEDVDGKEYKTIFELIEEKIIGYNYVTVQDHSCLYNFNLGVDGLDVVYKVQIDTFAPTSRLTKENSIKSIKDIVEGNKKLHEKPNLYSVGLKIRIGSEEGPITICLSGDINNTTLQAMHPANVKNIFDNNVVLKIPHHGSPKSDEFIRLGHLTNFHHAVTTTYSPKSLPDEDLLKSYKNACPKGVVCHTGKGTESFGITCYKIPIIDPLKEDIVPVHTGGSGVV